MATAQLPVATRPTSVHQPDDDSWTARKNRTVRVTVDPAGRPFGRGDFAKQVSDVVGLKALQAAGPTHEPNIWELTFVTDSQALMYVNAGSFHIRGHKAEVQAAGQQLYKLRLHWVPSTSQTTSSLKLWREMGPQLKT